MNGSLMAAEIAEQPDVFRRILDEGARAVEQVSRAVRSRDPRFVLFIARGTSDHAALYGKYLVEIYLGLPAGLASPSTTMVYDAHPRMEGVLAIAVSQSGASPDVVEPIVRARAAGAITLAITNTPASPLAAATEFHLDMLAGSEQAVAATKTYTAELLTLFLLIRALTGDGAQPMEPGWVPPECSSLPQWARSVILDGEEAVAALAPRYRFVEQLVITARGLNYATARETALKLMETSYLVAHAFSGADLLHGPLAMIDRGFPVIALVPPGPGARALRPVLERLNSLGADTLIVGDPSLFGMGTVCLPMPSAVPESISPILTILPMQQLALYLARQRGLDPDRPRSLEKVTETI